MSEDFISVYFIHSFIKLAIVYYLSAAQKNVTENCVVLYIILLKT